MNFTTLLSEAYASEGVPGTGDVLAVGLPLLRQLRQLHAQGLVSGLGGLAHVTYENDELGFDPEIVRRPTNNPEVSTINPRFGGGGVVVTGHVSTFDSGDGMISVKSGDVIVDPTERPTRPVMVIGYQSWEQLFDHHDELTDIHLAGLLLTSYAAALDLDVESDIEQLATHRKHLLRVNPHLHPVVAGVLSDMINPDRNKRADLNGVIARLENYRDIPADLELDGAYLNTESPDAWRPAVLAHLRERVFDLTRRNRAIYFRPTASTVGLTEASVPLMLDISRIKPEDLLTWNDKVADSFSSGKKVNLSRWCRFEESPHVPLGLDKLISTERKMRAEFGFGRLRMVVAFLRWVDPETNELVNSPLVLLPAELSKKKGINPVYNLSAEEEAEVNPELRQLLSVRFGITLPPTIDASPTSIIALVSELEKKVQATDPAVRIEIVDKPRIRLIRQRAKLRLDAYRRRRAGALARSGRWRRQEHCYDDSDFRPLGLALFKRFVATPELPLRQLTDAPVRPRRPDLMVADPAVEPSVQEPSARESSVRERTTYSTDTGEVDRHSWQVDLCGVTLASIGSKRTTLVRDFDELLAGDIAPHPPYDLLFSPNPRPRSSLEVDPIGTDQLLVLPADDAQARAVRRAVRGDSFIIQGPPGTGKSQTITNLIAALVGSGKRVLFVCEKRAALDVVANRLQQVGLGHLTATIHDSQLDKRGFISDLGKTYQTWLEESVPQDDGRRTQLLGEMSRDLGRLEAVTTDLNGDSATLGVRELIERVTQYRLMGSAQAQADVVAQTGVSSSNWLASRDKLVAVSAALTQTGRRSELFAHPALRVAPTALHGPVVETASNIMTQAAGALDDLRNAGLDLASIVLGDIPAVARHAASASHYRAVIGVMKPGSPGRTALDDDRARSASISANANASANVAQRWSHPLSTMDARNALIVAKEKEGGFFSRFNGQWKSVKSIVESSYRFADHQIKPTITQVLEELIVHLDATEAATAFQVGSLERWGVENPDDLAKLAAALSDGPLAGMLGTHGFDPNQVSAAALVLDKLSPSLLFTPGRTLAEVEPWVTQTRLEPSMEGPLLLWADLEDAPQEVLYAALTYGESFNAIEQRIFASDLQAVFDSPNRSSISSVELELIADRLLNANRELLQLNSQKVANAAQLRFAAHLDFVEQPMAGRSDEDKTFKRRFNAGMKVLENEFGKKIRHKTIRELASGDPGLVTRDLAPIWLMSPLSVSDTLPLSPDLFDAVVFDEASQIPVEDAVPTVFRAPQMIVVGDRMQLPPTRFFSSDAGDDEDDLLVDADGHNLLLSLDADSFLTQSDLTLESTLLNWHYRSRSESLIAYSNAAFYDANLATIPDRDLPGGPVQPIEVVNTEDAKANALAALERPISFHRMQSGVYGERRNVPEADYIAELVRSLILSESRKTIGVVAFSEAQQGQIESALAELATLDSSFAVALEKEQERADGNEFVGLFVKNLENVQGDERDIIIMSVCYGPTANGPMKMNFGPINQSGGERRLNVIFSRAKEHMMIVSSIDGSDITNTHNNGAAHLARFLSYAAAESAGDDEASAAALHALTRRENRANSEATESVVANALAAALEQAGEQVDINVGRSGFRIDLAIRGAEEYKLGVVLDPPAGASHSSSRYLAEAGILKAFDWPIARVMITDWWRDPDTVVASLVTMAASTGDP